MTDSFQALTDLIAANKSAQEEVGVRLREAKTSYECEFEILLGKARTVSALIYKLEEFDKTFRKTEEGGTEDERDKALSEARGALGEMPAISREEIDAVILFASTFHKWSAARHQLRDVDVHTSQAAQIIGDSLSRASEETRDEDSADDNRD